MTHIGIDYSLNSPSVTIETEDRIIFMSFFNTDGAEWDREKPLKKFEMHNALNGIVELYPYQRHKMEKSFTYAQEQSLKMSDAEMMCELMMESVEKRVPGFENARISLEGFAYGSSGSAFIDLILFNSFLRKDIIRRIGYDSLEIIAPSSAKKLAGKGNADKEYMIKAFMNNVLDDNKLAATDLFKYVTTHEIDFKNIKPLDDIVDSYFIMKSQTLW